MFFLNVKFYLKQILLMKSQGYSNGNRIGKGNFCTKFSNTGTTLREIAHARKGVDNQGKSTTWRASVSRAVICAINQQRGTLAGSTDSMRI